MYRSIRACHLEKSYPIEALCKLLGVSRSAYYKWAAGIPSKREQENAAIAEKMEKIHADSPDKGYRRINDDLRHDHGIHVNDKPLWIAMHKTYLSPAELKDDQMNSIIPWEEWKALIHRTNTKESAKTSPTIWN